MTTTLTFAVRRRDPELVGPASPTPHETKRLSDIDDQESLRQHAEAVFFYRGGGRPDDDHPAIVIRRALGEALVPYYPLAGRLREVDGRKLVVDCAGEGVLFAEADADVRLSALEAATGLRPPFPCVDELLLVAEGSSGELGCPLLLVQVTRLLCGGFALALRVNHAVCDATGAAQFICAVAELARGLPAPSVAPVWRRELLEARTPPSPQFPHREYDAMPPPPLPLPLPPGDMVVRTITFTRTDIAALRERLRPHLRYKATTFEVLAAAVWRARTAALDLALDEEVRLAVPANFRRLRELGLPAGFYGNAVIALVATTTARALLRAGGLGDAVELVRAAKAAMTAERVRSTADFLALRGRPALALANTFLLSDTQFAGFQSVDFGWGQPVYGGPVKAHFVLAVKNGDGEDALAVPLVLPRPAMDRFVSEIEMLVGEKARADPIEK